MLTETQEVAIHMLPPTEGLPSTARLCVVVDVLRASTTVISALHAGATAIVPCLSVDDAKMAADQHNALLGGERAGIKLEGFDFGNSPTEYTAAAVTDKVIAFTTTNGTRALLKSLNADEIVIGSFVNLSAVAARCCGSDDVHIVCAGTDRVISSEDVLFAGLLAAKLIDSAGFKPADDATQIAMDFSLMNAENPPRLLEAIRQSQGGRNLIGLGCDADIEFAANVDRFELVPAYDAASGRIQ
jgi:2-phosphosulfolactate phosphatase